MKAMEDSGNLAMRGTTKVNEAYLGRQADEAVVYNKGRKNLAVTGIKKSQVFQ